MGIRPAQAAAGELALTKLDPVFEHRSNGSTALKGRTMALSRTQIVEAAYAMLREHGLAGLSMRRLAQDLGVQAGALYYHVASKQDLLAAVAERILSDSAPTISAT